MIKRSLKYWHVSSRQHVCFNRLLDEYLPFDRLEPLQALAKGRGLAKLHDLELIIEQASDVCSHEREVADLVAASSAMPVEVDKIKTRIPQRCGACLPERWLRDQERFWYENQS